MTADRSTGHEEGVDALRQMAATQAGQSLEHRFACLLPYIACDNCFRAFTTPQIHDYGPGPCPHCGSGVLREVGVPTQEAPAIGVELLCIVCARYRPWGIWD